MHYGNQEVSPIRRRSLTLLVGGAVLAPLVVFFVYSWISYVAAFASAEARARHISKLLEEHAEKVFETISLALQQVYERIKGMEWHSIENSRQLWDEIRAIQGSFRQIGSLFVIDRSGHVPLTTRVFPSPREAYERNA